MRMDAASPLLLPEDHPLHRVQRIAVGVSAAALVVCVLAGFGNLTQLLRSYLVAYVFWVGGALGCLAILMIHHVTGGAWGVAIRRLLESGARTLPTMAILFLPIAFGVRRLYEWAQPERVAQDPLLQHKALYLNVPFFLARTAFYFIAWSLVVRALTRWSLRQDASFDPLPGQRLELISRGGLLLRRPRLERFHPKRTNAPASRRWCYRTWMRPTALRAGCAAVRAMRTTSCRRRSCAPFAASTGSAAGM